LPCPRARPVLSEVESVTNIYCCAGPGSERPRDGRCWSVLNALNREVSSQHTSLYTCSRRSVTALRLQRKHPVLEEEHNSDNSNQEDTMPRRGCFEARRGCCHVRAQHTRSQQLLDAGNLTQGAGHRVSSPCRRRPGSTESRPPLNSDRRARAPRPTPRWTRRTVPCGREGQMSHKSAY